MKLFNLIITYEPRDNNDYTKRKDECYTIKAQSEKEARLKIIKMHIEKGKRVIKIERIPKTTKE